MKIQLPSNPLTKFFMAAAVATTMAVTTSTSYGLIASDNSGNYVGHFPFVGQDGGTGFGPWTSVPVGGGGSFIGGTGLSASSFGIYSGGASGNSMAVFRPFDSEMAIGDVFTIQLGNTGVDGGGEIGLNFYSAGSCRLTLKFVGGASYWQLSDGGSAWDTTIGWAGGKPGATLNVQFTRGADNHYSVQLVQNTVTYTAADYISTSGVMAIDKIALYSSAQGSGQNLGFNNLRVVVPEPSTYALLGLGGLALGGHMLRRRKLS